MQTFGRRAGRDMARSSLGVELLAARLEQLERELQAAATEARRFWAERNVRLAPGQAGRCPKTDAR